MISPRYVCDMQILAKRGQGNDRTESRTAALANLLYMILQCAAHIITDLRLLCGRNRYTAGEVFNVYVSQCSACRVEGSIDLRSNGTEQARTKDFSVVDLALIGGMTVWGANMIAVKAALGEMLPLAFNALRFVIAASAMLVLLLLVERNVQLRRQDIRWLLVTGVVGNCIYQFFFINGINLSTAGNTAFMMATAPIWVAALGCLWAGERLSPAGWAGVFTAFCGIVLIIFGSGDRIGLSFETLSGDLLTLTGAVCWATYTLMTKPLLQRYSPLKVTACAMVMGTVPLLLLSTPALRAQDWSAVSVQSWGLLLFSSLGALVLVYNIWSWGVRIIGGARTAVYNNLAPIMAGFFGYLIMGEHWTLLRTVGAITILTGVYLVRAHGR